MSDADPTDDLVPLSPPTPRRKSGGRSSLAELIRLVVAEHGVGRDPTYRRIVAAWRDAAGTETFEHTRVARVQRGTVTIEVDSAPLLHELETYMKSGLLQMLRAKAKAPVTSIRFVAGARAPRTGERSVTGRTSEA